MMVLYFRSSVGDFMVAVYKDSFARPNLELWESTGSGVEHNASWMLIPGTFNLD